LIAHVGEIAGCAGAISGVPHQAVRFLSRSLPKINATAQKAASGADKSRLRAVRKPNEIILA